MISIYVGYDSKETVAYHVCSNSLIRNSTVPISINPLALHLLCNYRELHNDGSNKFIYSRFLVPYLQNYCGWAIYMDGDMVVLDDIKNLFDLRDDNKAVQVVKHNYKTRMPVKYLGSKNEDYPRKNWSSVIIWNCSTYPNRRLTPEFVQKATGAELHRFTWIQDQRIGELPREWNWLPDEYGANPNAKLLHYTLGTPCFHEFADTPQGEEWHRERLLTDYCLQRTDL